VIFRRVCTVGRRPLRGGKTIDLMQQGQNGVTIYHPRTRITHDNLDPASHGRLVAVDRTAGTSRFLRAERATVEPAKGVLQQFLTLRAQAAVDTPASGSVMGAAVNAQHGMDGPFLPGNASRLATMGFVRHLSENSFAIHHTDPIAR
jgi:hypothetical protein